ncbi:Probable citrate synthase 1 [Durusdinium trenchii]|uniref:Citrate synthase n=1 Tax=Durusdinium trenchii TaxID=1381693 RepID=A0ABP0S4Z4_9DINO
MERVNRLAAHVCPLSPQPVAGTGILELMKTKIAKLAKEKAALKADLLKNHGERKIQDVTVEMAINGARAIKSMVTETSDLDANKGIAYRHLSLYEVNTKLPKAPGGSVALPEGAFWLLVTGEEPSAEEVKGMTEELHKRATIPANVMTTIDSLPKETHPMTQLSVAMLALQKDSKFFKKYQEGMKKDDYWSYALEDCLDVVAKVPIIAAKIYRRTFHDGKLPEYDPKLDWAANFAQMLGINQSEDFKEAMRLYLMLHADHEGGNVSAHATHLVGSALSDPYYAWAAGLCGLAGPLHGLANQECLSWLLDVQKQLGGQKPTKDLMTDFANKTLKEGKVIPGFGHAVLRNTDPRYMLEREFALKHCTEDPLFQLVDSCYQAIPPVLLKQGKVKNPFPNVDAHSGQLMHFYNLKEQNFYTVVFAVSRTLGVMAQYIWSRAVSLPIERPKSLPLDELMILAKKHRWQREKGLVINYADPATAAGTAVLGLGLVVLPLLSKLNQIQAEETFQYKYHGETNPRQPLRLFTESELRQRLGSLDAHCVAKEIVMSTEELDEHMEASSMEETDDEVGRIQKWRDSVNGHLRSLQKRSALAFLGLPPDSSMNDINAVYKKMALELHPDKGGDPEKFQELQEMKERLTEIEKEEENPDGKKENEDDPEEEEAKKQKEKEEEEEKNRLPPNERVKKLRMEVHDNTVRLWEKAKKSRDEIVGEKALKTNAQPALNILRLFVDRFVASEIKTLRHDDTRGAEAKLRKFLKQGAEILCVAALADVQATLSTLAMHFNYRLIARSGSPEIKNRCAALLEAVGEVPRNVESFLQQMEADLADQKERDLRRKEERAAAQRRREARGDFGGDAGETTGAAAKAGPKPEPKAEKESAKDWDGVKAGGRLKETAAPKAALEAPVWLLRLNGNGWFFLLERSRICNIHQKPAKTCHQ